MEHKTTLQDIELPEGKNLKNDRHKYCETNT